MRRAIPAAVAALVFCGAGLPQRDHQSSQQPAATGSAPELHARIDALRSEKRKDV